VQIARTMKPKTLMHLTKFRPELRIFCNSW
jgi:hypothetical protein